MSSPSLHPLLAKDKDHICSPEKETNCVRVSAVAHLPTRFGVFQIVSFSNSFDGKEHVALVHGDIENKIGIPVRMHSECLTGESFGSLRCDCRGQLELAMKEIAKQDVGIILYLRQEGRGIGLLNKIKAYELQDMGMDTMQANEALGFRDDERDYAIAAHMLRSLGVTNIRLMTNNPDKLQDIQKHGITVLERLPVLTKPNKYDELYLRTKMEKAGHMLDDLFPEKF